MNACRITVNDQLIFEADSLQEQLFSCVVTATDAQQTKEDGLGPIHLNASARTLPNELSKEVDPEALRAYLAENVIEQRMDLEVGDRIVIEVR